MQPGRHVRDRPRRHEPQARLDRRAAARRPSASRSPSTRTGSRSASSSACRSVCARPRRAPRPRPRRSARRSPGARSGTPDNGGRMLQSGASPGDPPARCAPERTPLEQTIAQRAEYGMNTDPAYVQSLMPDGYTDAERKWIEQLRELEFGSDVHEYLIHWRKDWGGTKIVAVYPADAVPADPARPPPRVPHQEPQAADEVARPAAHRSRASTPTTTSGSSSCKIGEDARGGTASSTATAVTGTTSASNGQRRDSRRRDQG